MFLLMQTLSCDKRGDTLINVLKSPSQTSRDRTTILFAGSHTYGTIAAAKFFTEDLHKHLHKLTRNGRKNLVILVSAHIVNGYPTKISIERSYEVAPQ